ncbi:MAG: JAB domain-containing protein [Bacteroidales bacterium]|nr:JAB domain-containing protein [Bacteroidales bacterium]MBP3662669.1 JAB domain-containing protein [Bacteroidales bacterium]
MTTDFKVAEVQLSYKNNVPYDKRTKVRDAKDAYKVMLKTHNDDTLDYIETFKVLYLNQNNHVLGCRTISEGGLASTCCDVRTILQGALLTNAVAIILAHNHPSGNVKPSTEDINTTAKITKAAKLLDISVLDHIIYTRENCYSFADDGEI